MAGIIGKKIGMTQLFDDAGNLVAVTVIEAGPCPVTSVRTLADDGYEAVQLAFEDCKDKHITKPELGRVFETLGNPDVAGREVVSVITTYVGVEAGTSTPAPPPPAVRRSRAGVFPARRLQLASGIRLSAGRVALRADVSPV